MKLERMNKVMKYLIVAFLLILLVLILVLKTDDCAKCSFKFGGNSLKFKEFMGLYAGECFKTVEPIFNASELKFGNVTS